MANIHRMTKKRLGELLLQEDVINEEQLSEGLEEQQQTGELIGDILVRKGFCTESDVARTISTQFSFPYISVMHYYIAPEMVGLFPLEELEKNLFVPIDRFGDVLNVVVAGLLDQDVVDEIERTTNCTAQVYVGMVSEVKQVIKEKFAAQTLAPAAAQKAEDIAVDVTSLPSENLESDSSADLDPALADLQEALSAAGGERSLTEPDAGDDLNEPPAGHPGQQAGGVDLHDEPQDAGEEVAGEEAVETQDEDEQEDPPKKPRRFRFFESD